MPQNVQSENPQLPPLAKKKRKLQSSLNKKARVYKTLVPRALAFLSSSVIILRSFGFGGRCFGFFTLVRFCWGFFLHGFAKAKVFNGKAENWLLRIFLSGGVPVFFHYLLALFPLPSAGASHWLDRFAQFFKQQIKKNACVLWQVFLAFLPKK